MIAAVLCVGQKPLKGKVIRVTLVYESILEVTLMGRWEGGS